MLWGSEWQSGSFLDERALRSFLLRVLVHWGSVQAVRASCGICPCLPCPVGLQLCVLLSCLLFSWHMMFTFPVFCAAPVRCRSQGRDLSSWASREPGEIPECLWGCPWRYLMISPRGRPVLTSCVFSCVQCLASGSAWLEGAVSFLSRLALWPVIEMNAACVLSYSLKILT